MNQYDFSTLNDKEFEQIVKDLLNAKYNLGLQDFKRGRDQGRDLRFSTPDNNNAIVVQVKHYIGSKFAQLKDSLKRELEKIKKLNPQPQRYMVATSLPLSANQKDEIKELLAPFILTSNDIFEQKDLNGFLRKFKEIEKNYFKLWFSSVNILQTVLNNAIEGRSRYKLEEISEKIKFYVVTEKLDKAIQILEKEKLLLITGLPGVGKTTLAEVILFDRARKGFKVYEVTNIKEAEDVISTNPDEKQVFYFNDFLGATYLTIINEHKTETQLTSFVERIRRSPNKYLILTSRTVILNQAVEKYEKISHSRIANQQFEIKLSDYEEFEKAQILYNHFYFKNLPKEFIEALTTDKFYHKIIQHQNYNPRIIDFITRKDRIEGLTAQNYADFVLNHLNNPKDIWQHSFKNQIGYFEQCFLLTLFTCTFRKSDDFTIAENKAFEKPLMQAFENRLQFEKTENNRQLSGDQFDESVRILLNGFIQRSRSNSEKTIPSYDFINPSLTDFLINYVQTSFAERKSIISSIVYVEQLERFNPIFKYTQHIDNNFIPFEKELQTILLNRIAKEELKIYDPIRTNVTNYKYAIYLYILHNYCKDINKDETLLYYFKKLDFSENFYLVNSEIMLVLLSLNHAPKTAEFIKENFILIVENLIKSISEYRKVIRIPSLFEKYEQDYQNYVKSEQGYAKLDELAQKTLVTEQKHLENNINKNNITNIDDVLPSFINTMRFFIDKLRAELFPHTFFYYDVNKHIDWNYWKETVETNLEMDRRTQEFQEGEEQDDVSNVYFLKNFLKDYFQKRENIIDELFERFD